MAEPARRRATYEDVLRAPAHHVAEVIDGTLYVHPRPAPPHAMATTILSGDLTTAYGRGRGGPGGWLILFEPEIHLPIARTLEAFRLDGTTYRLIAAHADDETPRVEPFHEIAIELAALWVKPMQSG